MFNLWSCYFDKLRSIGFKVIEEDYKIKLLKLVEKYCLAKGKSYLFVLK
jgi:hypothetical protein